MKIYFAVSIRGGRELLGLYKKIADSIVSHGHTITNAHVILDNVMDRENVMDPLEIYKRDMQWMDDADLVIGEVTTTSLGVGYELGRAVEKKKKIYCFYDKTKENSISMMIRGNSHIVVKSYESEVECLSEIEKIVK
jgi:nucleoside 2-deoxyribosyltransferase